MVAVVSGSGLGLFNTSGSTLKGDGTVGSSTAGRGPDQVFVNSANGNLIIQNRDEALAANGLDLALVRTYNSQGLLDDDNGDNWRLSVHEKVQGLTGTVNTSGSTVTKVFGDGAAVVYTYNVSQSRYVSSDGDGADDTLSWNGSTWTWTDGSSRNTETYDSSGRLTTSKDTDGNTRSYSYTGSLLTQIVDGSSQTVSLTYSGTNLTKISVTTPNGTQTLTSYTYDGQNRLSTVTVDHTPADNAVTDGNKFTTTYTYDGTSKRVASITHSDGTFASFTYEQVNGVYRVKTYSTSPTGAVTANANSGVLSTTDTQTNPVTSNVNQSATVPGWTAVTPFENSSVPAVFPTGATTQSGNSWVVWLEQSSGSNSTIYGRYYNAATDTWSLPVTIASPSHNIFDAQIAMDEQGNATVAWTQSVFDGQSYDTPEVWIRTYSASSGWAPSPVKVSPQNFFVQSQTQFQVKMNNGHAAVCFTGCVTGQNNSFYVARIDGGVWQGTDVIAPAYLFTAPGTSFQQWSDNGHPTIGIDSQGNLLAMWEEMTGPNGPTNRPIYSKFRSASSGTWSSASLVEYVPSDKDPAKWTMEFQPSGSVLGIWRNGYDVHSALFNPAANSWGTITNLGATSSGGYPYYLYENYAFARDAAGNGMLLRNNGNVVANYYTSSTNSWSADMPFAGTTFVSTARISYNNGVYTATWIDSGGGSGQFLGYSRYNGTSWSTPANSGFNPVPFNQTYSVQIQRPTGDVVMVGRTGNTDNIGVTEFYPSGKYYIVPTGATWSSVALALYGYGDSTAANALQTALGFPALTAGTRLQNLPPTLSFTVTTTTTVPPYYAVVPGDTWATITQAIYGTSDANAIAALQSALGNPTLTAGVHLTVPATLSYNATPSLQTTTMTYNPSGGNVTIAPNNAVLSTTETTTTSTNYPRNSGALTTPSLGWSSPTPMQYTTNQAAWSAIAYNASGNGFAISTVPGGVLAYPYSAATESWGTPATVGYLPGTVLDSPVIAVDAAGNAIVAYVGKPEEADDSVLYASTYYAATGTWSPPMDLGANWMSIVPAFDGLPRISVSMRDGIAALTWVQKDIYNENHVYVRRFVNGSTNSPDAVGDLGPISPVVTSESRPTVAVGAGGDVYVSWASGVMQTTKGVYVARYSATTSSWGPTKFFPSNTPGTLEPVVMADAAGNAIVTYIDGNAVVAQRFDAAGGAWVPSVELAPAAFSPFGLTAKMDDQGNAVVAWFTMNGTSTLKGVYYNGQTKNWGTTTALATVTTMTNLTQLIDVAVRGNRAIVSWSQVELSPYAISTRVSQFDGTSWGSPVVVGPATGDYTLFPSVAIDARNNVSLLYTSLLTGTMSVRNQVDNTPYYLVPASSTWASIANTLYGTSAVAGALQAALGNPTLVTGMHLRGMPTTLTVPNTVTNTVAPYYTVKANDTWTSIATAVYGTADPAVVSALQAATGNPALTVGAHITMPQSLTYSAPIGLSTRTDIQSPLGLVTTLLNDNSGRLISVQSPTVGSSRLETRFVYDTSGNVVAVTEDPSGLNRTTTHQYDSFGNVVLSRDASGNTISRTYSTTNQLLTETRYLTPDPDGAGAGQPSNPMTTRYAYDSEDHLRYVISADGRVTEFRYNTAGDKIAQLVYTGGTYAVGGLSLTTALTEAQLNTWIGTQDLTKLERTDYSYDARGLLSTSTAYVTTNSSGVGQAAGASLTRYVYDQRGLLLQKYTPRGEATTTDPNDYRTSYTYDGLGRLQTITEWISAAVPARTTTIQYDDAHNKVLTTYANGRTLTEVYDAAGRLVSSAAGQTPGPTLGTTLYSYDRNGRLRMVVDPVGGKSYTLYDEAGRKSATVDADGTLVQFIYNRASQLVKTVVYSDRLSGATRASLTDAQGNPANVTVATLIASITPPQGRSGVDDQITRTVYDASGRVVYMIDPAGAVTQRFYDGAGRVTDEVAYATTLSIANTVDELSPGAVTLTATVDDRHTRNFYDNDGNLLATLDAAGYLVEYTYNAAGHLVQQTAYANATPALQRAAGTLTALRPQFDTETAIDPERDIISYFFYDGEGRRTGVLDGEGYLTETVYDVDGNASQVTRYNYALTYAANDTVDTLKGRVPGTAVRHTTSYQYDGLGNVTQETNFEGTITSYVYTVMGELKSKTVTLSATESLTETKQYDVYGRLIKELTPQGSIAIAAPGLTQQQIDFLWDQYSVKYEYDEAGRRTSMTDQYNNKILYYYDADGRLAYTINALGETTEQRYNALGQLTDVITYNKNIATAGLKGGTITAGLLAAIATDAKDAQTSYTYRLNGRVFKRTTSEGQSTTYTYDAFGEEVRRVEKVDSSRTIRHDYVYDQRGQLVITRWDPVGIGASEQRTYDAFGRLTYVTDQRGNTTCTDYDRLGRTIQTFDPLSGRRQVTYDAFSRTLTTVDALNNTTTYVYDDSARSVVVTTPEGISATTTHRRDGQTLAVVAGGNTTTYGYDANGKLQSISDSLGSLESRTYDRAGRLDTTTNGRNSVTKLTYDAASRVLTRTVDYGGSSALNQVTVYEYDGQGRVHRVTEPNGKVTVTEYDRDGRVILTTVDPGGLNIQTAFAYNWADQVVSVTEGVGTAQPRVTNYIYDTLGRRTQEELRIPGSSDPPIITQYFYDARGNLTRKQILGSDASQFSTWYVYDSNDRVKYTVDFLGGVTETLYDAEGRVTGTRHYATPIAMGPYGNLGVISITPTANSALDRLEQTVYDRDGRAVYEISAAGTVTERKFDTNGKITQQRTYSKAVAAATYTSVSQVVSALGTAGNNVNVIDSQDRLQWAAYDVRGRGIFSVDGSGAVVRTDLDNNGNVVSRTEYATLRPSGATDLASLQSWATANASATLDRTTRYWYDTIDRLRFTVDAEGYVSETKYNDFTREVIERAWSVRPILTSTTTLADLVSFSELPTGLSRSTTTLKDVAGRVKRVTDFYGKYDEYDYDAAGNRTRYTNKKGDTWNYEYDAGSRLVKEIAPPVLVTTVSDSGGQLISSTSGTEIRLETRMTYNGLGSVTSRTEAANTSQSRRTEFYYDAVGHQVRVVYPPVSVYDASADSATRAGTAVVRTETSLSPTSETAYDALGNAFRNKDVGGGYSFKAYDSMGRVKYDVDVLGYVTRHDYDAFGNEVALVRYANALSSSLPTSTASITIADVEARLSANTAADRTIVKGYDRLNRVVSIRQPTTEVFETVAGTPGGTFVNAAGTTITEYSAFGEVVRTRRLVSSSGTYADTYFYYDRVGNKTAEIDPLGYTTGYLYDEVGNVLKKWEYAKALTPGSWSLTNRGTPTITDPGFSGLEVPGFDRVVEYGYDALNRKISESLNDFYSAYFDGWGILQYDTQNTYSSFAYDAVGNQTQATIQGATTYTWYDALGRVIAIAQPGRNRGDGQILIPLVAMKRDAYGNLVETIAYANSLPSVSATAAPPPLAGDSLDRHTYAQFDNLNHVIRTQDAAGANRFSSYNARGDLMKEWQYVTNRAVTDLGATPTTFVTDALVTMYEYDKLGRRTAVIDPQTLPNTGDPSAARVVRTQTAYNAFGEITGNVTSTNGTNESTSEYFDYDQAGHLWRTNTGDGVDKVYLYDVSGNVTAEIRHQTVDLRAQASASAANSVAGIMRTENAYDVNGRLIEQRQPQYTLTNTQDLIVSRPYIATMATTVPPNAVYQAIVTWNTTYYILKPVPWSEGGGYYQVSPPSLANPQGTYARVAQASYQLVQAKQLHWPAPTQSDVVATFEYWPVGSPGSITTISPVLSVSQGELGVNVQSLAAGQYGYRISYKKSGSSSAFATQTGTFDAVNGTVNPTGATSAALTVRPTTSQAFDRWGNVIAVRDTAGNITEYRYNQLGQLTHTLMPSTRVVDNRMMEDTVKRADIENVYDVKGRLLQARDGEGNGATVTYNEVGQALTRFNASGRTNLLYDIFGNVLQETDALGYRVRKTYDKADRVLTMVSEINLNSFTYSDPTYTFATNEANVQRISYGYDQAGRKITETNGEGEVLKYWYDLNDNIVRRRTAMNFDTVSVYDAHGRQTSETDADGSVKGWSFDAFGRVLSHTELSNASSAYGSGGGAVSTFAYNKAGLITGQTSTLGQNISMVYDEAGHLTTITDSSVAVGGSGLENVNRVTQYGYDDAGRKVRDKVTIDGRVHQDTRIGYDELSRIRTLDDPDYHTAYTYDGAGNRSSIIADYRDHTGVSRHQELYYKYDEFNRVLISQGVKTTGAVPDIVVTGDQGAQIEYNARGERISVNTRGTRFNEIIYLTNGVESSRTLHEITPTDHLAKEYYEYDGLGRLTTIKKYAMSDTYELVPELEFVSGHDDPMTITARTYDKASRIVTEQNYYTNGANLVPRTTVSAYDDDGRAITQTTTNGGTLESIVTFGSATYSGGVWSVGYDGANVLRGYSVAAYINGAYAYTTTYKNQYRLGDSYQETSQFASSAGPGPGVPTNGSTSHTYNVDGELTRFTDFNDATRTRYFANDQSGQALTVIQGQFDGAGGRPTVSQAWDAAVAHSSNQPKTENFFFADGHYVGEFGQLTDPNNAFVANFDVNYTPVSDAYPANAPSQIVVQHGDTLRIIAQRVFGDASLWYIIAQANGLATDQVTEGTVLTIPNDVISLSNTYSSFKPFDADRAIGDTTPTQPVPPPPKKGKSKKGCGVLGTVLIIVVAIVVTIVTYGAAAPMLAGVLGSQLAGAMVAGAIAGAAGSIVSQGVGIAIGQQDSFNWKGVASAAIAGGLAPGIGAATGTVLSGVAQQVATAAITNAAGQGVNIALGLQDQFSWSAVAASAVAAPVASRVEARVGNYVGGGAAGNFAGYLAGGAVQQVASVAFNGGRVDYANLVADAFGNVLGTSVSARVSAPPAVGHTADDYAEMNAQIAAGMTTAQDEFDSLLRRDLAEQSMRLDLEANTAQQIRMSARDINEGLVSAIESNARMPQIEFTEETVDPITAAEYAARAGRTVDLMKEQSLALANEPAFASRRYGGGAATMRDNGSGFRDLGWQDAWFTFGAFTHGVADPIIELAKGAGRIFTDFDNSLLGRTGLKISDELSAWNEGGFTSTDLYGSLRDRAQYYLDNPLRLDPTFASLEASARLGAAGVSWWQGANTEQRLDALGNGAGMIATLWTPDAIVGIGSIAVKGDALFSSLRLADEALASRNVWRDFAGQAVDLGGGAYGPTPTMLAQVLETGGGRAQTLAEAIRSGDLSVTYGNLPAGQSGRFFPGTNELTLNGNMNWSGHGGLYDAAATVAHEGQHWMDDVAGIAVRGMKSNEMYFEARAFLAEQHFADSVGMPRLGTLGRLEQEFGSRAKAWEYIKGRYGY